MDQSLSVSRAKSSVIVMDNKEALNSANISTKKVPPRAHNMSKEDLAAFRSELSSNLLRLKGRIRKIKADKGFGFISGDDGIDYFFHWTAVKKVSIREFRTFELRDRVEFSPIQPPDKQWRAIEIEFVDES